MATITSYVIQDHPNHPNGSERAADLGYKTNFSFSRAIKELPVGSGGLKRSLVYSDVGICCRHEVRLLLLDPLDVEVERLDRFRLGLLLKHLDMRVQQIDGLLVVLVVALRRHDLGHLLCLLRFDQLQRLLRRLLPGPRRGEFRRSERGTDAPAATGGETDPAPGASPEDMFFNQASSFSGELSSSSSKYWSSAASSSLSLGSDASEPSSSSCESSCESSSGGLPGVWLPATAMSTGTVAFSGVADPASIWTTGSMETSQMGSTSSVRFFTSSSLAVVRLNHGWVFKMLRKNWSTTRYCRRVNGASLRLGCFGSKLGCFGPLVSLPSIFLILPALAS
mmetsp:Transcript_54000/g.128333  ORF Transcript_54000/g.128333 Transcript_54000/m.128333 type:complete len:337 (-) Transcript_54000:360-1370(-)